MKNAYFLIAILLSVTACKEENTAFHRCLVDDGHVQLFHQNKTCKAQDKHGILSVPLELVTDCRQYEYWPEMGAWHESEESYISFSVNLNDGKADIRILTSYDCQPILSKPMLDRWVSTFASGRDYSPVEALNERIDFYKGKESEYPEKYKDAYVVKNEQGEPISYSICREGFCSTELEPFMDGYYINYKLPVSESSDFVTNRQEALEAVKMNFERSDKN